MVLCTDLPAAVKPSPRFIVKDIHSTDQRIAASTGSASQVLIARSADDGFEIGQRFIASRIDPKKFPRPGEGYGDIRVTGVIRVTAINEWHALAVTELLCDTVEPGDHLNPYIEPPLPTTAAAMLKPDFDDRAELLFGADNRFLVGDGDVVSINRGSAHGVTRGARFAIYRDKRFNGLALIHVGEAVVMTVNEQTSKVAITKAFDGIEAGDTAVPRRLQQ
jgi:hypothetical protein